MYGKYVTCAFGPLFNRRSLLASQHGDRNKARVQNRCRKRSSNICNCVGFREATKIPALKESKSNRRKLDFRPWCEHGSTRKTCLAGRLLPAPRLCRGAPCSHQRTWAETRVFGML